MKRLTFILNATLISAIMLSMLSMQGMNKSYGSDRFKNQEEINKHEEKYEVRMWNEKEIHLSPEETKTKSLYTNALSGCTAYAFIVKCMNQSLHAQMSHYPPTNHRNQKSQLREANQKFNALCENNIEFKKLIVMSPLEDIENDGKWEQAVSEYDEHYASTLGDIACVKADIMPYYDYSVDNYHDFKVSLNNQKSFYYSKSDGYRQHSLLEKNEEKNNC